MLEIHFWMETFLSLSLITVACHLSLDESNEKLE
jgi:hypothetical protein